MDSPYILFHFILFTVIVSKNKKDLLLFSLIWINKIYFPFINYVEFILLDSTEDQILDELFHHEPWQRKSTPDLLMENCVNNEESDRTDELLRDTLEISSSGGPLHMPQKRQKV